MNTVLIASRSPTVRGIVQHVLGGAGMNVHTADDAGEALDIASMERPDVALCDLQLRSGSGYDLGERIRRLPELGSVRLVLLASAFEPVDEERARRIGAEVLSKPFEMRTLIEVVRRAMAAPPFAAPSARYEAAGRVLEESRESTHRLEADPIDDPLGVGEPDAADYAGDASLLDDEPLRTGDELAGEEGPSWAGGDHEVDDDDPLDVDVRGIAEEGEVDLDAAIREEVRRLAPNIIREVAWEVVPDILERLAREAATGRRRTRERGDDER